MKKGDLSSRETISSSKYSKKREAGTQGRKELRKLKKMSIKKIKK